VNEKRNLVGKFERSEGSATVFCRKHKISSQSLRRWQRGREATKSAPESTPFVELEVASAKPERPHAEAEPAVELDLGSGMVLRIYRGHFQQR
jgi:hypothetical protein